MLVDILLPKEMWDSLSDINDEYFRKYSNFQKLYMELCVCVYIL